MLDKNTHNFSKIFKTLAKKHRMKVAIGIDKPNSDMIKYLRKAHQVVDLTVVGEKIKNINSIAISGSQEIANKLIELIDSNQIDAIVRGQIHPRFLFLPLFQRIGMEISYFTGEKQVSVLMLENQKTKRFFTLGSAELGQGYDLEQKKYEAVTMANYLKNYGLEPYVGVMAMRRVRPQNAKPIVGYNPNPLIDENYNHAETLVAYLRENNIKADFFNIEYETAIEAGVNIIIPPIGPIGNAFARSLVYFSQNWKLIAIPMLHFRPLIIHQSFKTGYGEMFHDLIIAAAAEAAVKKFGVNVN